MWNVSQTDDGMHQNTLPWFYGDYVLTNQQT